MQRQFTPSFLVHNVLLMDILATKLNSDKTQLLTHHEKYI